MVDDVSQWAERFHRATLHHTPADRPTDSMPSVTLDDAYTIQEATIRRRLDGGETIKAIKLGLTQRVEQDQWSIPHPTFGTLTDAMLLTAGDFFSLSSGRAPKVEAEIVVVISRDISHPVSSVKELRSSLGSVHAGIEILDSRYHRGEFHPLDAVADNQSALSGVWSQDGVAIDVIDIVNEFATLTINGEVKGSGSASRILGNPLNALLGAVNEVVRRWGTVPAGLAVFSGNLCESAVAVSAGDEVTVSFSHLGTLVLSVVA